MPRFPVMRTTLRIDDDVYEAARSLAETEGMTVGEVLSSLARQALAPVPPRRKRGKGFPTFPVKPGARPITARMVREALEEP